jgi:hypothetical protein
MKKLIILVFTLITTQTFAQRFGIKAGLARTTYKAVGKTYIPGYAKSGISTAGRNGITLGGFVDVALNKNLMFRPGLSFVTKGAVESGTYTGNGLSHRYLTHFNFTAVDFPLDILYKMNGGKGHFLLGGGIAPGLLTNQELNRFDAGVNVLAGYQLANGFSANVTYHHGLLNVATKAFYYESLKNRHLGIVLGYSFPQQTAAKPGSSKTETAPLPVPSKPVKALFAELGGPGGIPSLNFDTRLTKSAKGWGLRIGIGSLNDQDGEGFGIPLSFNYLAGKRSHFLEMAAGAGLYHFDESNQSSLFDFPEENSVVPFVWFGYRYQPVEKRFFFRAGFNQFLRRGTGAIMNFPFPGLSFGYSFR